VSEKTPKAGPFSFLRSISKTKSVSENQLLSFHPDKRMVQCADGSGTSDDYMDAEFIGPNQGQIASHLGSYGAYGCGALLDFTIAAKHGQSPLKGTE
jgi:hypothetical protein